MGYDMYLLERDESRDAEKAAAERDFDLAAQERNKIEDRSSPEYAQAQAKVEEAYGRIRDADLNYFRLNNGGMGTMREHMYRLGMLATEYADLPPWPAVDDFGLTQEEVWSGAVPAEKAEAYERFQAAHDAVVRWSPPDEPGIPVHKFGSNDGWVVTPRDIEGALAMLDKAPAAQVEAIRADWREEGGTSYFDDWLDFLRRAQAGQGFEVY